MASLAIADVPWISKRIKACCRRAKLFSTEEILLAPPQQLQQALRISSAELELLVLQVATAAAPPSVSVLDALNGKPPSPFDDNLFGAKRDQDGSDADSDSDNSQEADGHRDGLTVIPPTQGYDGNYPGVERYIYDSDSDSDSHADARSDHEDMHDDVEVSSTFRARLADIVAGRRGDEDDDDQYEDAFDGSHGMEQHNDAIAAQTIVSDVLSLGRERHVLTTGSQELDQLLGGGFRSSILTELVGESSSGKTQIAIQTATFATLGLAPLSSSHQTPPRQPWNRETSDQDSLRDILQGCGMAPWTDSTAAQSGVGVCYITSAGERGAHSIVKRALELAEYAIRERFDCIYATPQNQSDQGEGEEDSSQSALDRHILLATALDLGREQLLRNLHVACVADIEALEHALKYSLPGLISQVCGRKGKGSGQIGMVVVDDLPSLFQEDPTAGDIDSLVQRSRMLSEIADALKRLAAPHHLRRVGRENENGRDRDTAGRVVLVVNHVSDAFGMDKDIARRFVLNPCRTPRLNEGAYPDTPVALHFSSQSAFVTGLLAGDRHHPRTAQLGHTWTNLINVRVFLSRTRAKVAMPEETESVELGKVGRMASVRKVGVVMNPFGKTMSDCWPEEAMLRFIITPHRAVQALASMPTQSPGEEGQAEMPVE